MDATLSVTKAARLLGVHPNTVRAWSDQGRLRYYRINPRGDRRYRLGDLQGFLAAAEVGAPADSAAVGKAPASGKATAGRTLHDTAVAAPRPARRRGDRLRGGQATAVGTSPLEAERYRVDLQVLSELATLASGGRDLDLMLGRVTTLLRDVYGFHAVAVYARQGESASLQASAASTLLRIPERPPSGSAAQRALVDARPTITAAEELGWQPLVTGSAGEIAVPIPDGRRPWGVLTVSTDRRGSLGEREIEFLDTVARALAVGIYTARLLGEASAQVHRLEALRRVAGDIGSRLDLDQTLAGLVDHAIVLFQADRAAVFLVRPDGHVDAEVSRGLSASYIASVREFPTHSLPAVAVAERRPLAATAYADDPRGAGVRAAVIQEGFDTLCTAPMFDGDELLGLLNVYHDREHEWTPDELETMAAFAAQASVAIKTARNYSQMARWAAQLQSIQQLGARLNGLTSVREIGMAIATELGQLLDFHNVRVYRLHGRDLIPVAMRGRVGEYVDETPEQLRVTLGEGITGWVAEHRIAQNLPDAAKDPRAATIPGTEADLDESMLLAPMVIEDRVLGVLVLSRLGLNQFSDDDLRIFVIYASFAAQAMANADATESIRAKSEALERQLRSQRELLHITESILTTLDSRDVLEQITDRLGTLVRADTIAIELFDRSAGVLRPLTARGVDSELFMEPWATGEEGLATWVIAHNEPQLVIDELVDGRVLNAVEGSLICVPLLGREEGATGVLTLERLGSEDRFGDEEFELVKLFAAQVSIALQNAEVHRALAVRARTDALTGLLNHGTFQDWLRRSVAEGAPFSLVMIDLDDFKAVNDALGHQAGDRLLHDIAGAIVAAGRESDHVFRYGGDEFVLILPETRLPRSKKIAERLQRAIHAVGKPGTSWHDGQVEVSSSVGLATYPDDGETAEAVLLAADRACFVAKRRGHALIATADEGLALAGELSLQRPTPVDPPTLSD